MTNSEILDAFARYVEYDPKRTSFVVNSPSSRYYEAGKVVETLLEKFDPEGTVAVMYAKKVFREVAERTKYSAEAFRYLTDESYRKELESAIAKDADMYGILFSKETEEKERKFLDGLNAFVESATGTKLVGTRDEETELEEFAGSPAFSFAGTGGKPVFCLVFRRENKQKRRKFDIL